MYSTSIQCWFLDVKKIFALFKKSNEIANSGLGMLELNNLKITKFKIKEMCLEDPIYQYIPPIVIFYTEILTGKVVLWCFFLSETSEKIHNSTFQVKISV